MLLLIQAMTYIVGARKGQQVLTENYGYNKIFISYT